MKIERDTVTFESTGFILHANNGIIGINPSLEISEGYDGGFSKGEDDEFNVISFTKEERAELADYMIGLWQRFKETSDGEGK